ncbi:hypothetical protein P9112_002044 [Eukaryota sp. TZLM1-RC]
MTNNIHTQLHILVEEHPSSAQLEGDFVPNVCEEIDLSEELDMSDVDKVVVNRSVEVEIIDEDGFGEANENCNVDLYVTMCSRKRLTRDRNDA